MSMSMVYLLGCLLITLGALSATYKFATKDWPIYAMFFASIGSIAFGSATSVVLKVPSQSVPAQEHVQAK